MPRRSSHAPDALLCEHCGYDLAGLTRADNCPECGTPIAASLPENRTGTPWQRGEARAWVRTAWMVVRHPNTVWGSVINENRSNHSLLFENSAIAAALFLPSVVVVGVLNDLVLIGIDGVSQIDTWWNAAGIIAVIWLITTLVGAMVLWVLTAIEARGIAHFGRRRGWRTDRTLARTICAHSGVMWIFAGVLSGLGLALDRLLEHAPPWGALIGFLIGMLLFETWVYLGFRAMRFANPPGAERHLRDHAAPSPLGRGQSAGGDGSLPSPQPSDPALNPPEPSSPRTVSPSDA